MNAVCPECGAIFERASLSHVYCSKRCYDRAWRARRNVAAIRERFEPREFECSCCGRMVEVVDPNDRRERFCSHACERKFWRDCTRHPNANNQRLSNYHSLSEYMSYERRTNEETA